MLVENEAAYLIHSRKYTDLRILVELLTKGHGRVSGVLRQPRNAKGFTLIQPFTPVLVNWRGKSSLKTITQIEPSGGSANLQAQNLYCGLYINEIIQRALPQEDPCEDIFTLYMETLNMLAAVFSPGGNLALEPILRRFELRLLSELGFGVNFHEDIQHHTIEEGNDDWFRFVEGQGFIKEYSPPLQSVTYYSAATLVAIRELRLEDVKTLRYAKIICRLAMKSIIGNRPLKTRDLFCG